MWRRPIKILVIVIVNGGKVKALLIVDHGSTVEESNQMLLELASLVRKMRPGLLVHTAHLEVLEPSIAQGLNACVEDGATEIVVHPYMLAPGRHATKDVPRLVHEAAKLHPSIVVTVTGPLGLHEKVAEVILERAAL
jgi:sirohydrochlorin cobaltochelatase